MYISLFIDINNRVAQAAQAPTNTNIVTSNIRETIWDMERLTLGDKKDSERQSRDVLELHRLMDHLELFTEIDVKSIERVRDVR